MSQSTDVGLEVAASSEVDETRQRGSSLFTWFPMLVMLLRENSDRIWITQKVVNN